MCISVLERVKDKLRLKFVYNEWMSVTISVRIIPVSLGSAHKKTDYRSLMRTLIVVIFFNGFCFGYVITKDLPFVLAIYFYRTDQVLSNFDGTRVELKAKRTFSFDACIYCKCYLFF